ncbi:MAG: radical SAM protein [Gemmatimonadales bacterium]|nr:MAG: radical SAM protein [Gemmatimonadales bacterium]
MDPPPGGWKAAASAGSKSAPGPDVPTAPLEALDQLWFQVSGTVCNLRCRHCFISCAPDNHSFWFMTREQVRDALEDSVELGVKEYYFTGGEPFMNHEMEAILADTLELGPATVLTNATLMPRRRARALARLAEDSLYTLEMRVSLDGITREMNDAIRGEGAFDRCVEGTAELVDAGFLPIITCMRSWPEAETEGYLEAFRTLLAGLGYHQPRIKILPPLLIGEEAKRTRGYEDTERITHEMLHGFDLGNLLCSRARLVTARGVQACPILLESPAARLGDTLAEAASKPAPLGESACFTCYLSGSICSNTGSTTGADR